MKQLFSKHSSYWTKRNHLKSPIQIKCIIWRSYELSVNTEKYVHAETEAYQRDLIIGKCESFV